ncbi:MAG: hypothetical protein WCO69_04540 [Candidatus Omnitrophota bacterium]
MINLFRWFYCLFAVIVLASPAMADRELPKPGEVTKYYSGNKKYEVGVIERTITDGPAKMIFSADGKQLWEKNLTSTPGAVHVSNDGQYIVLANWGWADEGGYKSLSFYKGTGDLIKEVGLCSISMLNGKLGTQMKWLRNPTLSADGQRYAFGENQKQGEKPKITMYSVPQAQLLWEKNIGAGDYFRLWMSKDGSFLLLSSYSLKCQHTKNDMVGEYDECKPKDAMFTYFDGNGTVIWEKSIVDGFQGQDELAELNEDGLQFKIYDATAKKWVEYVNQGGKVLPKNP